MKKCPFCAEEIKVEAIKCRYCGTMLEEVSLANNEPADAIKAEVSRWLTSKGKIEAIKFVREKKGLGLAEAKAYVETLGNAEDSDRSPGVTAIQYTNFWIVVIVMTMLLFFMRGCSSSPAEDTSDRSQVDHSNMAFIQCRDLVRERLRAPSTADFPYLDFESTEVGNQTYVVRSYVDAQNAFGAQLRSDWTCRIRFSDGDDADGRNWTLVDLDISEP